MSKDPGRFVSRRRFVAGIGGIGGASVSGCIKARSESPSDTNDGGTGPTNDTGELVGEIGIAGSSTVFPLTRAMRIEFLEKNPDVRISVGSTGTGGGFGNFFCTGERVINGASRPIKSSELEQCRANDIEPFRFRVATDALTVVVNNDADFVDCVTIDELKRIWGPDGADRWSDVREDWDDEEFELYGPASTSGTFDYFTETVVGEEDEHREDYQPTENDNTILTGVKGSKYAMGYLGFSHYTNNSGSVKAVKVEDSGTDAGCVGPSLETAAGGSYTPLSRPLFVYVSKKALAQPAVRAFCRFYIKHAASKAIVADAVGYVPLTKTQQAQQLGRLELAIDEVTGDS